MNKEEMLRKKIEELKKEIEKLEKKGYATQKWGKVTNYEYNSDIGVKTPFGERDELVSMSSEEKAAARSKWESDIYYLKSQLRQAQDELYRLEYNKPENVAKREEEQFRKNKEEYEKKLVEARLEHEKRQENVKKLIEYLRLADLDDLARNLDKLRLAYQSSDFIKEEIELRSKEKAFSEGKIQTTKREYKEVKRSVIRLNKSATKMAKKYKDLYRLYSKASSIVYDIEEKHIMDYPLQKAAGLLYDYFREASGDYYTKYNRGYYTSEESKNKGYEELAFYRDFYSKYNEGVRKGRI